MINSAPRLHYLTVALIWMSLLLANQAAAEPPANAVWIDVRTPAEFRQGHLAQARLIPFDAIEAGVAGLSLEKDTPIYLYCSVGGRAEIARQRLEALDYNNVTNVGSLENARKLAGE